jgi:hypothetical protein
MRRREIWGAVLLTIAAVAAWADHAIAEAYWAAAREDLLLYLGIPGDSIASWFRIAAIFAGAAGTLLLFPALIGRIPRKIPRRIIGWTAGTAAAAALPYFGLMFLFAYLGAFGIGDTVKVTANDGRSALITQDGFDGDIVDIYTEHDGLHYKRARSAPGIPSWPRVKDQHCQLDADGERLQLTCGTETLVL